MFDHLSSSRLSLRNSYGSVYDNSSIIFSGVSSGGNFGNVYFLFYFLKKADIHFGSP